MVSRVPMSLTEALDGLRNGQREAVRWDTGPLLVLAGPGSGKTHVLTLRIAKLLQEGASKRFRILALTFTNKAADEMRSRLARWIPEQLDRVTIGTFHSVCADILRTHGSHIGFSPDFRIYSSVTDQLEIVEELLADNDLWWEARGLLEFINECRSNLIRPESAAQVIENEELAAEWGQIYQSYNDKLRALNALDFEGLVYFTVELLKKFPKLAEHYHRVYSYWCVDEFQDTNKSQFELLLALAGSKFKNVFAVGDEDQVLYEWNGASHKRLVQFKKTFEAEIIQLPTNYRCPMEIVQFANQLIVHNRKRFTSKKDLTASKGPGSGPPLLIQADDEYDQAHQVVDDILQHSLELNEVCILARTRKQLEIFKAVLDERGVPGQIFQRQNDFLSSQFRFLVAALKLAVDRTNPRLLKLLAENFSHFTGTRVDRLMIATNAQIAQGDLLWTFCEQHRAHQTAEIVQFVNDYLIQSADFTRFMEDGSAWLSDKFPSDDLADDCRAWSGLFQDIKRSLAGRLSLPRLLQELDLRSKEPPKPKLPHVQLLTVHSSKGKEFAHVYVIGLAEGSFPSYQAIKADDVEEERRNCYVAITRTLSTLTLAYPARMNGFEKPPSRFLKEMGLL